MRKWHHRKSACFGGMLYQTASLRATVRGGFRARNGRPFRAHVTLRNERFSARASDSVSVWLSRGCESL
jgi:hypothetical protein